MILDCDGEVFEVARNGFCVGVLGVFTAGTGAGTGIGAGAGTLAIRGRSSAGDEE